MLLPYSISGSLSNLFFLFYHRRFQWTYVSVVYSDTEYGNNGYDLLAEVAAKNNICISEPQSIDVERFVDEDYQNVIRRLMFKINARGTLWLICLPDAFSAIIFLCPDKNYFMLFSGKWFCSYFIACQIWGKAFSQDWDD